MCFGSRVERKGERVSGARLKGAGGSWLVVVEGFEVEVVVLKARAFVFPFGGILLSCDLSSELVKLDIGNSRLRNDISRPP